MTREEQLKRWLAASPLYDSDAVVNTGTITRFLKSVDIRSQSGKCQVSKTNALFKYALNKRLLRTIPSDDIDVPDGWVEAVLTREGEIFLRENDR
jgi:hypothetical protein